MPKTRGHKRQTRTRTRTRARRGGEIETNDSFKTWVRNSIALFVKTNYKSYNALQIGTAIKMALKSYLDMSDSQLGSYLYWKQREGAPLDPQVPVLPVREKPQRDLSLYIRMNRMGVSESAILKKLAADGIELSEKERRQVFGQPEEVDEDIPSIYTLRFSLRASCIGFTLANSNHPAEDVGRLMRQVLEHYYEKDTYKLGTTTMVAATIKGTGSIYTTGKNLINRTKKVVNQMQMPQRPQMSWPRVPSMFGSRPVVPQGGRGTRRRRRKRNQRRS